MKKCVLALGFFDGVHLGHAALLRRTAEKAAEMQISPAVMTFDTHPDTLVLRKTVPLINSAPDRAKLIRDGFGIDRVEFFRFTEETMRLPWDSFLDSIVSELGVAHFVVGYDFRFGWQGIGNCQRLQEYCAFHGLTCDIIGKVEVDGVTVSSTHIRSLLSDGQMEEAARFMGHCHILTDVVHQGHRLGRRLGAPTINMQFAPGVLVPRFGVYAVRARLPEGDFPAVTNIGIRPTVGTDGGVTVESHILGYEGNLYGRSVTLEFLRFLRPEKRFGSMEELSSQIAADGEASLKLWEENSWIFPVSEN